jgi:GMP synthase-like glutamine amidotransferase
MAPRGLNVTLVDCGSRTSDAIGVMLEGAGAALTRVPLDDARPHELNRAHGVVISGGPRLFSEEADLLERFAFIDRLAVPALGICLGHQALGLRHGADFHRGVERRAPEPISWSCDHALLAGLGDDTVFAEDHCEGISLPPGFVRLGRSPFYDVEAMACDERRL